MKNLIYLLLTGIFCLSLNLKPPIPISGFVTDQSGETLIGVNVLEKGTQNGTITDINGNFLLTVADENAVLEISYTGFMKKECLVSTLKRNPCIVLNEAVSLDEVIVLAYRVPLIEQDNSTQGGVVTADQIRTLPTKNINGLAAQSAGVGSANDGGNLTIRGSRSNSTDYYVDGIRVRSASMTPQKARKKHKPKAQIQAQPQIQIQAQPNTEDYSTITENRFLETTQNPLSTFSIDVDAASYSNMRRFIYNGQQPPKDAIRIEELINYFDYDYPQPEGRTPFEIVTEVSTCPWAKEHQLLHIGLQGKKTSNDNLPPSNIVFLLDVSGSMNVVNKLPLLKSSLKLLVNQLRAQDKVSIVVYAGAAGLVLPPTSGQDKQAIIAALDKLQAGGSTAGGRGIELAYDIALENFEKEGNNRVVLATDGDFNVGVSSDGGLVDLIEEKRKSGVFLTVLGFGMGNYKDNKMQQLANKGNGNHAYIDNIEEAKKTLVNAFGGTLFTIAKDVKLQLEFNPKNVSGYRLIGYENRMLHKEDFKDDTKDAGELGAGHTVTALYEIIPAGVNSSFLASVDPLKYQKETKLKASNLSEELVTIKLRYKQPKGSKSILLDQVVSTKDMKTETSENFQFSAAVAEFGMLLRDSQFKGTSSFTHAIELASSAQGKDEFGYRAAFIGLMERAKGMLDNSLSEK